MAKSVSDIDKLSHGQLRDLPDEKILRYVLIHFRPKSNCFFEGMSFWDINDNELLGLADKFSASLFDRNY